MNIILEDILMGLYLCLPLEFLLLELAKLKILRFILLLYPINTLSYMQTISYTERPLMVLFPTPAWYYFLLGYVRCLVVVLFATWIWLKVRMLLT